MKSIDLTKFAHYSQKLPRHFLRPETHQVKPVSQVKVLAGFFADFWMCVFMTSFMAQVYNLSVQSLLVTKGLRGVFAAKGTGDLALMMLPLTVFSYFFLSYFFNHGQTWGMHLFKTRLEMKSQSFKESALWALQSLLVCFTSGVSFAFQKTKWQAVHSHDYLYQDLMVPKDIQVMNLLDKVREFEKAEVVEEYNQAA